ncbi:MAG TPA: Asp-tRNA(Asn)/Glu-tRNA(Gln) amidotransferase subunit GatB [Firmicutes bacterium]|jgi:aspartyl-tRNA(Asn)/glutamyl-tRNA(Gln) amidotransferase subunit C|nr:Asp-tRNA(Asn)/Glu-tRNA(Gln) amidotransferase subunit GatB [Bacillota bacterium]
MPLTKAEVEHVARLARLELSESEKEEFPGQLNGILDFVEKLNKLDTASIEPTAHAIPVTNVFRPDQEVPSFDPELALANAPDRLDNFFKVPKILEEEE